MSRLLRGAVAVFGLSLLAGCVINPPIELSQLTTPDRDPLVLEIPFFPQERYQCGPAALAGLLAASGVDVSAEALVSEVYLPARQGSLQIEMKAATRRAGRIAYEMGGAPEELLAQIEAGRPVLLLQNLGTHHFPFWHYAVLVGFDAGQNRVILNSGLEREKSMSAPSFLRSWDWAGRWALLALAPGELPARPDADRYLAALADFEVSSSPADARRAWLGALEQWPTDARPYLALGNLAYAQEDFETAAAYYRRGMGVDRFDPALGNNLATVLGELGCARLGEKVLHEVLGVLADGSPWRPLLHTTLAELAARPGEDQRSCRRFEDSGAVVIAAIAARTASNRSARPTGPMAAVRRMH